MINFNKTSLHPNTMFQTFLNMFPSKAQEKEFKKSHFLAIMAAVCLFYSIFVVGVVYYSCRFSLEDRITTEARHINNTLTTVLDETAFVMAYVGKQIAQLEHVNIEAISKILINSSKIPSKNQPIYSWSLFDWVDPDGYTLINSQIGIIKKPFKKVSDSYVWKCSKYPWILQFSAPTLGNTSGMWVIPTGIGVSDSTDNYLGALNVAFNIAELNTKIEQSLVDKSSSFLVLDENFRIILQSTHNPVDLKSSYYYEFLRDSNSFFMKDRGNLIKPINYNDNTFYYYIKMKNYPYIILTGYNNSVFAREFQSLVVPRIIELITMGCFCICLFYYSRKKYLNLLTSSTRAKEKFFYPASIDLYTSVFSIISSSSILLSHLKGERDITLNKEKQIKHMSQIYDEATKLNALTTGALNLSQVDVNQIIDESVTINASTAFIKNIIIKCSLTSPLPALYADAFRLKQIISGFINLSLEYNPHGSIITVHSLIRTFYNHKMLIIKIEDDGFSLNIDDIRRISKSSDNHDMESNGLHLDFSSIEKLIKLHYGKCAIYSKRHKGQMKGKIVSIILPYYTSEDLINLRQHTKLSCSELPETSN